MNVKVNNARKLAKEKQNKSTLMKRWRETNKTEARNNCRYVTEGKKRKECWKKNNSHNNNTLNPTTSVSCITVLALLCLFVCSLYYAQIKFFTKLGWTNERTKGWTEGTKEKTKEPAEQQTNEWTVELRNERTNDWSNECKQPMNWWNSG